MIIAEIVAATIGRAFSATTALIGSFTPLVHIHDVSDYNDFCGYNWHKVSEYKCAIVAATNRRDDRCPPSCDSVSLHQHVTRMSQTIVLSANLLQLKGNV